MDIFFPSFVYTQAHPHSSAQGLGRVDVEQILVKNKINQIHVRVLPY
jgi:hypothetical protein